ncbi:MAG TPA: hypothetical protein VFJ58_25905 [Armatimonadota bacterium]|nr:hypothetical protein [Armatimonadota bacterium]
MPDALTKDQQWERLKKWLNENIEALDRGSLERLPASFTGERGAAARDAYETCLEAMRFLEDWERYGLPREGPGGHGG